MRKDHKKGQLKSKQGRYRCHEKTSLTRTVICGVRKIGTDGLDITFGGHGWLEVPGTLTVLRVDRSQEQERWELLDFSSEVTSLIAMVDF